MGKMSDVGSLKSEGEEEGEDIGSQISDIGTQNPEGIDVMSRAIAEKLHTPEVIAEYEAKMAEVEEGSRGELMSEGEASSITGNAVSDSENSWRFSFQKIKEFFGKVFGF